MESRSKTDYLVTWQIISKDGKIKEEGKEKLDIMGETNATITNKGLEIKAKLLNGVASTPFTYVALGSGTTYEANDQTALVTEITTNGGARAAATCEYEADYKAKWTKTFNFTGSLSVNEVGIFDAASNGNMLMRHKFSATKSVENGDSLAITIKETESRA